MDLKKMRLESGLKISKIAESLGVCRSQFYCIETAKNKPDKLKVEKLAELYNCTNETIIKAWEEASNAKKRN